MLLYTYTANKEKKLEKSLSLFNATPLFEINMPSGEVAPVFDFKNFPFEIFKGAPIYYKKGKTVDRVGYYNLAVSFDIETTTIEDAEKPFAFMYQWQYCIEDYVFMGRTWEEFVDFNDRLTSVLNLHIEKIQDEFHGISLVCYVFNLSFEFTFANAFMGELVQPLFTDIYAPLIVPTANGITYRCAYRLTNKTLDAFTKDVPHHKLSGEEFDYSKRRTSKTPLSQLELSYCYNDVKGLCEALRLRLDSDPKYNIASIPLTSTGYVRKDCQRSMRKNPKCKAQFQETKLDAKLYSLCRMAFRGGNTHANARYVNHTVGNDPALGAYNLGVIKHYDIMSSYPRQIMCGGFPRTKFEPFDELCGIYEDRKALYNHIKGISGGWCLLIKFKIYDFEYDGNYGVPYIAKAKTFTRREDLENGNIRVDNGRIFSAPVALLTMTEIDFLISLETYKFSKIEILEVYKSVKGLLPYELRRVCMEYFKKKCELSGSKDPSVLYERARSKELLNAIYGLLCTRIDRIEYKFVDGHYIPVKKSLDEMLEKFYDSDSSFLPYQYALWVTSLARAQLHEGCKIVGKDLLYIDTDSVFYVGNHEEEFEKVNKRLREEAYKNNAVAFSSNGKEYACGIWERDCDLVYFKTLGAKKYCLSEDGKTIKSTISGVSKNIGQKFFTEKGFDAFNFNTVIPVSGKVSAHYNTEKPHYITIDGVRMLTASNIALISSSYSVHIKKDYAEFIDFIHRSLKTYYN